ncbi:MAG: carboxypeptidase-like regulatory domain-containing protein [Acidobacteriia bacterium]|nr:carboxypeptidase-like regulatory domain-containing protein [Terriglobia bacterium]
MRGVVLDEAGKPLAKIPVALLSPANEHGFGGQMVFGPVRYFFGVPSQHTQEASVESKADGTFEFPAVPPGDWTLRAEAEPKRDARRNLTLSWSQELPATVTDHSLDGLEIRFPETLTLQATFDWGDHPPPHSGDGRNGLLLLTPVEGISVTLPPVPSESDGKVTFENVPAGRYRVIPIPGFPAGYYSAAVLLGTQDILGQPVDLAPGMPPVRVVYRPGAGTVRGTVADEGSGLVLLWPQNAAMLDLTRVVQAGTTGAFEIGSVAPGDYHLLAVDRKNLDAVPETVLRGAAANATGVHVDANSTVTVNPPLTHVPQ